MQSKGLSRNTIDKYYTKDNVVELCLDLVKKYIKIEEDDLIIEPSAGNGAFIQKIKMMSNHFVFYDIEPEHEEIIKQDYLLENSYICQNQNIKNIHVIGNPPFGRQSSMAIKFIKKSCEFCNSISFILPKSFKKNSLKKNFPLCFHNIIEVDLPDKSFLVNGVEYNVPCIFQIWEKRQVSRTITQKIEPINFCFVKKIDNPDISVRRVGVNAGKIDINTEKNIQSHYFIKFTNNIPVEINIQKLSNVIFETNNTVGPKSISKQELIIQFNLLLHL